MSLNPKRRLTFTVNIEAEDLNPSHVEDVADWCENNLIEVISNEGWEVKNIKVTVKEPKQ